MVLLCYDGSDDAKEAADRTAVLFPHTAVTVLSVWEPFVEMMSETGYGAYMPPTVDLQAVDAAPKERAEATAAEGAERLRRAGLATEAPTATRGIKSLLLGSVSHAVLQHAERPVVVVPSPTIAAARAAARR